ncbi:MAG: hypothetical protein CML25_01675 [Rhizobiales bacterium]|nr:hypothetical protein [Hyphomicrobiales bacterium]
MRKSFSIFLIFLLYIDNTHTDSFTYNSFNNHGVIGLINTPTARFYDESSFGFTLYDGNPDQKITMSSSPFDWLEASFFYTNIQNKPYCDEEFDPVCDQDYKDKGFNFKLRIKEEGNWPAIAIGINDIAGSGFYSSEYIVGSYGIRKTDLHFGLGWGSLNGSKRNIDNPLGFISDDFYERPNNIEDRGGQFQPSRYFSGETASPFLGITHAFNEKYILKVEYDTTITPGKVGYKEAEQEFTFGLDINLTKNFTVGISSERGNTSSIRFSYKDNPKSSKPRYRFKESQHKDTDSNYIKFIRNLNANGIGVNKIYESAEQIGVQMTQFSHPNLDIIDEIIRKASYDAGFDKPVKKDLRIVDLKAKTEYDYTFEEDAKLIYQRQAKKRFKNNVSLSFRPFLASREEFFKGALMIENTTEYSFLDNFYFSSNIKYSLADNFDDLQYPPVDTYPAQVRSDVKDYLKNFNDGVFIGRAQFDYYFSLRENHHLMFTTGILEEMFNGVGFEYLFFDQSSNYAIGFEMFDVKKRDYKMQFGTLDYSNVTGHLNFYFRNYGYIPFDAKISYGEYLAGDEGITIDFSRSFSNGTKFGIFASFTDVSTDQFGEGSFDKGIYFNIPVFGNFINYSWRPLTKDPGAKLIRKNTLYDLLVKFRPIN